MILPLPTCSLDEFSRYTRDGVTSYSTEYSSLRLTPSRIYDDACDVGFKIKSNSGNEIIVSLARRRVNDEEYDGEFLYDEYAPLALYVRRHPLLSNTTFRVFND